LDFRKLLKLLKQCLFGTSFSVKFIVLLFHNDEGLNQTCIACFPNGAYQAGFSLFMHNLFDLRVKFGCVKLLKLLDRFLIWKKVMRRELGCEKSPFGNLLEHTFDDIFDGLGKIFLTFKVSNLFLH
jgi:hypothetical protein